MPNLVTVGGVVFELSRGKGSAIKQLGRQADAALHYVLLLYVLTAIFQVDQC